jgi:hypothetical protein
MNQEIQIPSKPKIRYGLSEHESWIHSLHHLCRQQNGYKLKEIIICNLPPLIIFKIKRWDI